MKVKFDASPDSEIKVETDAAGNVVSVTIEPLFAKRKGQAVLAYGVVTNDNGVVLDRFSLLVSGATGKVGKTGRVAPVRAEADSLTAQPRPAKPAKPQTEGTAE